MPDCPNCSDRLATVRGPQGSYYFCRSCAGRAVTLPVMHRALEVEFMHGFWPRAMRSTTQAPKACPFCHRWMNVIHARQPVLELDACLTCMVIWFDEREFESVPGAPPEQIATANLDADQRAREIIALHKVEEMARSQVDDSPDSDWKMIPAIFGLPVETHDSPLTRHPWFTWTLAVMIAAVSIWAFTDLETAVAGYGLVPSDPFRHAGMTWLASFFLHGGWLHLLGNLYFFLVFADNVEDQLGPLPFLGLLLLATVVGDVVHVLAELHSTVPCIGASGGISGIIAYYALQFPHARIGILWRYYFYFRWVNIPAWAAFLLWLLLQLFGTWKQLSGFSNVSAVAHLGGAATGFVFWLVLRRRASGSPGKLQIH